MAKKMKSVSVVIEIEETQFEQLKEFICQNKGYDEREEVEIEDEEGTLVTKKVQKSDKIIKKEKEVFLIEDFTKYIGEYSINAMKQLAMVKLKEAEKKSQEAILSAQEGNNITISVS